MPESRITKTIQKLRTGELPDPTAVRPFTLGHLGGACTGCGEAIAMCERSYEYIRVDGGAAVRFHVACHETWVRFKRNRTTTPSAP